MIEIQLPQQIKYTETDEKSGIIVVEPLHPGYGLTIGNALRRVLISSLPGSAVTGIKIKGADHEFSTIDHIKEDVVDIILNIKQLHLKLISGDIATINLKVKGEKIVTAADIKETADVEITNKELVIATLTDKTAELDMELTVENGLGYFPVESREKEKSEIGVIAIDAIFTPVLKARFDIENVRVGKITNYDKLTLEIVTDGTLTPTEVFKSASAILVDHFDFLKTYDKKKQTKKVKEEKGSEDDKDTEQLEEDEKKDKDVAKK
ncbi:DNA-directed RNA polymerase subunit alpha [Patescibacteria group bacterium]|nr:DNA-directed RNA polymerase subunit alpha [Patescibacteria group bacterium]